MDMQVPLWNSAAIVKALSIPFQRALTKESPQIGQPQGITVPLKPHQKALIHAMVDHEEKGMTGIPYNSSMTYTNYGILGEDVGSGKSLVVLGYLAHQKTLQRSMKKNSLHPYSKSNLFTVFTQEYSKEHTPSLIIVPHTIYRQWQEYCKKQTNLDVFYMKSHRDISGFTDISGNYEKMVKSDVVLVSNTLYGELQTVAIAKNLIWKHSIHHPDIQARWLSILA
jgi:hypothetical protein